MEFLGFEINRPHKAAEPKKRAPSTEIGDSGTDFFQGIITEEYNSKLSGIQGIEIYDKMRKGDATVKAAVLATSLPIRRANWFVEPASEDAQDQEIAEFVTKALFEWQSITWNDLLRQALLCLPYGVMVFEKVFTVKQVDGKDWIIWKKFAPRLPKSIYAWETSEHKDGIQQLKTEGGMVDIPMDRLLIFVNEKEGDNWWGTSILRSAYKHWTFKDGFYKIDAVAFERQGLGVPKAKMPLGYSDEDKNRAETILKNLRAHEQAFLIEPNDIEVEFMDMKGKQVRDPKESIQHHNREIVKAVLAQFLELGATESGSRALSSDQSDLFLQSLEAVAGNTADVFNKFAIPQLVDLNYDNVTEYPELKYKGISRVDVEQLSTAYKTLVDAQGIQAIESDETHWRELLSLPERTEDDEVRTPDAGRANEEEDDEDTDDIVDDVGMSEHLSNIKKKVYPQRSQLRLSIQNELRNHDDRVTWLKRNIARTHNTREHRQFFSLLRAVLSELLSEEQRRTFQEFNDFTPENRDFKRPLTFAEEKVDFDAIRRQMDQLEGSLEGEARALFEKDADRFMKDLSRAVNAGDTKAIKKATLRVRATYTTLLKDMLKKAYEFGKNNSAREMGVKAPPNARRILQQIDINATTIAERHTAELTTTAKLAANEALTKGETAAIALAAADRKLREAITEKTRQTAQIAVTGLINHGRRTTFEANLDDIYALQRSELLDSRTCNYCLSIDGRIVEKTDDFSHNSVFHSGCRGIWVEILQDEENKPSIDGIPDTLRDRFGDAVNDLIQPKNPTNTEKNPDAQREIKKRRNRRIKRQQE